MLQWPRNELWKEIVWGVVNGGVATFDAVRNSVAMWVLVLCVLCVYVLSVVVWCGTEKCNEEGEIRWVDSDVLRCGLVRREKV